MGSMKRKLARNKARWRMAKIGLVKVNRRHWVARPGFKEPVRLPSYFADHWRNYT